MTGVSDDPSLWSVLTWQKQISLKRSIIWIRLLKFPFEIIPIWSEILLKSHTLSPNVDIDLTLTPVNGQQISGPIVRTEPHLSLIRRNMPLYLNYLPFWPIVGPFSHKHFFWCPHITAYKGLHNSSWVPNWLPTRVLQNNYICGHCLHDQWWTARQHWNTGPNSWAQPSLTH